MPKKRIKRELGDYDFELQHFMLPIGNCLALIRSHRVLLKDLSFANTYLLELSSAENQLLEWVGYIDQCQDGAVAWPREALLDELGISHDDLAQCVNSETAAWFQEGLSPRDQAIHEREIATMLNRLHSVFRQKALHVCDVVMGAA